MSERHTVENDVHADTADHLERYARSVTDQGLMDLWWTAMRDDWAVPDWAPRAFLDALIADLRSRVLPPGETAP